MTSPMTPPVSQPVWLKLSPATRSLALFVPLACLVVNGVLPLLPGQPAKLMTSLSYTGAWLQQIAHEDSWEPMRMARSWLEHPGDELLYQEIFFERGVKFQYPPTSLLVMDALHRLPGANWISNDGLNGLSWLAVALTIVLSVWILDRVARGPPGRAASRDRALRVALALVAGATFYPLVFGFYLGQVQTWIDALVAGLVLAFLAGRPATSGTLAGLACLIKPPLGLLVVWGLLRGQRRFVAGWLVVTGLGGALSLALYGLANHLDYLEVVSFLGRHGESFHHNQSFNGLLHRILGNGDNRVWENAFPPFHPFVYAATLVSSLALIGAALFWRRREAAPAPGIDLAIVIVSVTMASPIAWTHHYAVLLPLFALALPEALRVRDERSTHLALLAVSYLLVANTYRAVNQLAETPVNFLQSYVLLGGLLFLYLLYRLRGNAAREA